MKSTMNKINKIRHQVPSSLEVGIIITAGRTLYIALKILTQHDQCILGRDGWNREREGDELDSWVNSKTVYRTIE